MNLLMFGKVATVVLASGCKPKLNRRYKKLCLLISCHINL